MSEISEMRRRIEALERSLQGRPVRGHAPPNRLCVLRILDGQTVYNYGGVTYYGIKKSSSELTDIPTTPDPDVSTTPGTFTYGTDGIGRAILEIDGVDQTPPVIVVLDTLSRIPAALMQGDAPVTIRPVELTIGGGPTTVWAWRAYLP